MSKIISYMQEIGLTDLKKIERYFIKTDINTIKALDAYVRKLAFEDWEIAEYSPYLFVPSFDLSGFGGCDEITCKIRRAYRFDKFACLYSDVVYLYVTSITSPHPLDIVEENQFQYRYDLMCDFSLILLYSNLIERKIARIIPPNFSACRECFTQHILDDKQFDLLEPLVKEYYAKAVIEVTRYDEKLNTAHIVVKNLPDFFPEHEGYYQVDVNENNLCVIEAYKNSSVIQNKEYVEDFIRDIIYRQYVTSTFEAFMSSAYHSKFITSNTIDKKMIDTISKNTIGSTVAPVFEMPFISNIDTETLLKLRDSEYHAFNDYRIALDRAIKIYTAGKDSIEPKEIYDDIIYPAFVKLDGMFERSKKSRALKTVGELIVTSSTVTLGVMSSIVPKNPVAIASALSVTKTLLNQINKIVERKMASDSELEAKDFYFLWQLKNKTR